MKGKGFRYLKLDKEGKYLERNGCEKKKDLHNTTQNLNTVLIC